MIKRVITCKQNKQMLCFVFRRIALISILCCFILSAFSQTEYTVESVPNDHLKDASDYVSNPDGIISPSAEQTINRAIASIEETSTAEIAVVLLSSIGYDDIDDFATRLFTSWGLGKKNDNGLLFLLVYDQSQMVFRTGYGLEGVLPDIILSRVIREDISPKLRNGDFDGGIVAGISKVNDYLKNPDTVQEIIMQEKDKQAQEEAAFQAMLKNLVIIYLSISVIVFIAFLWYYLSKLGSSLPNQKKYNDFSRAKSTVLAFTIFFPALMIIFYLIFTRTIKNLRNKPPLCSKCGTKMRKLSEAEEDKYLSGAQQEEENVHSKDYDVWLCPNDGSTEIIAYDNANSSYVECPHCHAKTYYLKNDLVVRAATTHSKGQGERIYTCRNCGKTDIKPYIIPIILIAASSSHGRGGGFGGGFGGGGMGGGSWGGGRTGGGGARGGW